MSNDKRNDDSLWKRCGDRLNPIPEKTMREIKRAFGGLIQGIQELVQDLDPQEPPENRNDSPLSERKRDWTSLCNVLIVAKKLITGNESINKKRFSGEAAYSFYKSGGLERALSQFMSIAQEAAAKEAEYRKAGIILQGYYSQDKIADFVMDLLKAWGQDVAEEEPDIYAKELYNNSLINIRRQFQRVQDKLREEEAEGTGRMPEEPFERRLTVLERYHFSAPAFNELAKAIRQTRSLYEQVKSGMAADDEVPPYSEKYQEFAKAARTLSALLLDKNKHITKEKMEAFIGTIQEQTEKEKQRIDRMQADIDRAQKLYLQLCDALGKKEMELLMDSLNPKAGQLEGKTAEEIQKEYLPLIEQLKAITEEFKK